MQTIPALSMGDILRCWWPQDAHLVPGPKLRPVFVLGETMENAQRHVLVAYGTTHCEAERESSNGGDVIVKAGADVKGMLTADTRFDFNYLCLIPATAVWFAAGESPVQVTSLPGSMFRLVADAMRYAGIARILRRHNVRL
ncbi:hypothetical protein [Noviherbaspirillum galbum]|uniref:Uncharacterized protein n=1 Tax=Noviherbaspirillum galbum TaxID=2709383 RepID=A0A6B3SRU3_9BURK|nr:hypothetical protein [Noviherbaspirillum galbum]NEX63414.1 hypothetical protein [Noviherbaspirillum galbum]